MRDLIISIACMLTILTPCYIYYEYSADRSDRYVYKIEENIIPAIVEHEWDKALSDFNDLAKQWQRQKKISVYFLSTEDINEIDSIMSKTFYYIKMEDDSNATGEASYLKEQLELLHRNEIPDLKNVF